MLNYIRCVMSNLKLKDREGCQIYVSSGHSQGPQRTVWKFNNNNNNNNNTLLVLNKTKFTCVLFSKGLSELVVTN